MKKIIVLGLLIMLLSGKIYAFDESLIENDDGIYVETAASVGVPNLNARAAILYDVTYDRVLYEKNAQQQRANASTTKMMTALVAVEYGHMEEMVEVSQRAAGTGGSSINLKTGDKITLGDLVKGLLVHSGNDAAVAIAEHIAGNVDDFAKLMNEKAEEIGARNTHFVTPHGLDEENHYSTAFDLAFIAKTLLENAYLADIVSQKSVEITVNGNKRVLSTTNEMLSLYEGANGVKTGFTGEAGRCIVTSVIQNGRQLIGVILGCDSKKNRTIDSIRLFDYGFQEYTVEDLGRFVKNEMFLIVDKSVGGIYRITQNSNIPYPLKESEKENVTVEYNIFPGLTAPLEKGTLVGNIVIRLNQDLIRTIEVHLPEKIERKTWKDYFYKIFHTSVAF